VLLVLPANGGACTLASQIVHTLEQQRLKLLAPLPEAVSEQHVQVAHTTYATYQFHINVVTGLCSDVNDYDAPK
jgi:hypothetical protein